jgi:6-phosphofructokinase 1
MERLLTALRGIGCSAVIKHKLTFQTDPKTGEMSGWRNVTGRAEIVVAEGAKWESGDLVTKEKASEKGEARLGGIGERVALEVERLTQKETRACTLGHLQRGGAPTALDRILGLRFGVKAVQLIKEGKFGRMVSYQQYHVGDVSIEEAVTKLRVVSKDSEIVAAARSVGICFGD